MPEIGKDGVIRFSKIEVAAINFNELCPKCKVLNCGGFDRKTNSATVYDSAENRFTTEEIAENALCVRDKK